MYTAHASTLPFKENLLESQIPTWAFTLACTSDQLEVGLEPHPEDADGSVTPAEEPWKGIATPPSTEPQTFAFVKIDFGSCNPLVLANRLLHSLYIQAVGYKHCDIISKCRNTCRKRASDRGWPCQTERSIANALECLTFTCTTAWGLWYIMLIHLWNSSSNSAVSKAVAKNRWSTLSTALDWSKLISAASMLSSIPSRTSRIKYRLSWINLPFTAKVCSGPIRSLMTSCKRFAKTRAKIFNSVLSRVMGL